MAELSLPFFADSDADADDDWEDTEEVSEDGDSGDALEAELLSPDVAIALEVGDAGSSDGEGGVEPLVATGLDVTGLEVVGLFVVDVTGGGVSDDGATRGAGGAALVAVTTGAGAGATGSGARVGAGASTVC